jgi:TonB family protein
MKRACLSVLLLVILGPACRTAGPQAPPVPATLPEPLGEYVGEIRVLAHRGDEQTVEAGSEDALAGGCDVAVQVREVAFENGTARFSLDTIGLMRVRGRAAECERARPGLLLLVDGLTEGGDPSEARPRVDRVLLTPEHYLGAKGITFDLPPGEAPAEVASPEVYAPADEQTLGRRVRAWPEALLSVDPWYHHGSGRINQEGEVRLEVVVGTDGRVHSPQVKTGMGSSYENAVLRVLPLWRFEPARGPDGPVGARILLSPILRIF